MQSAEKQLDFIVTNLKEKNLKVTSQRIAIYHYLLNSLDHPTAEKVYKDLKPLNPNLSLGTVYKTLETFKSSKLILGFNVGESSFRYDGTVVPHIHFYCSECEKIFDIHSKIDFDNNLLQNFEVESLQGFLYGKCATCKSK
ncbi:MAG: Fur family transcriptional regulator [Lachnospirales bacterium]